MVNTVILPFVTVLVTSFGVRDGLIVLCSGPGEGALMLMEAIVLGQRWWIRTGGDLA
jgi:hypothetical protein